MDHTNAIRTVAPQGFALRRITDADIPFLADVYASTRSDELAAVPWTADEKANFLRWQFSTQHQYYQQYYPSCEFLVIEQVLPETTIPIGRLYVDRWPDQIRIVDIAILPAHRRQGAGTALLKTILAEADAVRLPVTIHVEGHNPALTLYRRLGFEHVDSNGVYHLMRRPPQ